ncbi:hypothetical protein OAA11_01675 [Schleiferiaceae bacterium]|nr:hypothetical protein [Schleiferiaceae bacterium]
MSDYGIYAGNMGYAHDFEVLIQAIEYCLKHSIIQKFYFIGDGRRKEEVKSLVKGSEYKSSIHFLDYLEKKQFECYTHGALFHAVVLKNDKLGVMVPSKFYTSIHSLKPVLYCGDLDSDIAMDILEYNIGCVIHSEEAISSLLSVDWNSLSINCIHYNNKINNKKLAARNIVNYIKGRL